MDAAVAAAQHIKGYELHERIGAGGFGAVYRAYQTTVGREVAIKIILPGLANQPDFIRRFEAEAQLVARLEHPHITPLYDYWRDQDGAYLVMRWLRGGSLRDALQNRLDLRSTTLILEQIASALSLAHRSNVIHRDIKPGNILLDEDGNAYLTDFGIAKDLNLSGSNTQPDAIIGSLDYISPEQARGEPVTPRTDIYSLGVTLYEVIAGQHPFHNLSSVERLYKHINDPMPEIPDLDPSVSNEINRVIQTATAKNPDHRYPDALAFAADFREAAGLNRTPTSVVELLTQREHDILKLIVDGLSNKEIAQQLTVTLSTVKWYVNQIYAKLGVRSRVQAMVRARELHLLGGTSVIRPVEADISSISKLPEPENPYKGLRAFQAADAQDFFGREELTLKLVKRLEEKGEAGRFLAVVGPSGSGKSSVVKAGLIPAIWRGELPGSEKWFAVEMLPGTHPLDKLEVALMRVAANQAGSLNEQLARDERGLLRAADLILPNDGSELLLVIDQFEEIFTLVEDETERQHFLNLLGTAARDSRSRVRVIVTLRADFYDRPLNYPDFGELVRSHMETILPLTAKGLERAISGPAERIGVRFEPGLVAAIVAEMNYQAGALPLLQYALTELFERREERLLTHQAYQEIGGAVGALAKRAEDLYRDLTPEGQEAARQMFLRLVTLGEGVEDTRRRALRSELLAMANGVGAFHEMPLQIAENTDLLDEIIDTYAAYRLLTLDNDVATRTPTVELAHEAILREWERLRNWLNDSRADIKMQRQLSAMADEWRANKEDTSYLARGSRLEQFEQWTKETNLALTPHERTFLNTSIAERERQNVAEQERQAREARLERRSRNFLRGLVAVLLLATLGAFGLTGIAVNQSNAAQIERDNAQRERDLSQSLALASAAQLALNQHNPDQAVALAVAANRIDNPPAFAQSTLYNIAYAAPTTRRLLRGHTTDATSAVFSPDEKRAVSSSGFGTAAGEIIVWDLEDGREIQRFGKRSMIRIALSPDGRYIAAAYFDREDFNRGDSNKAIAEYGDCAFLALWDVETGKEIRCFKGHSKWVWGITFSADGKFLFSASDDSTLIQWDTATGQIVRQFKGHQYTAIHLALSPDEHTLLSGSCATMDSNQHCVQGEMILWDIATGAIVRRYGQEGGELKSWVPLVVFSPDGKTAVSVSETGQSRPSDEALLWDVASGKVVRRFEELPSAPFDAAFSPDGRLLALAFGDGELILYDVATGKRTMQLYGHTRAVNSVAFSADGRRLLTASNDDTVRLWNLDNAAQTRYRYLYALSPDGRSALSGDGNDLVLWNTQTGEEIRRFQGHHDLVTAGAFSPDGRYVLSGSADKSLILWELATGKVIHTLTGHAGRISPIVVSPDGHQALSTGDGDPNAILWDLETGQEIHRFAETTDVPFIGGFSPDEHAVLVGYMDGALIMYDVATSKEIRRFQHNDFVSDAVFSPDGKYILSGSGDSLVHLWDVQTGQEVRRFTGHASMINQVVFSPNGRLALSGSKDNSVILWDVATGAALRRWESQNPFDLAFSPDGQSVFISAFGDNTTQRWQLSLDLNDLLAWTRTNRYIPELTCDQRALYRLEPLCDGDGATPPSTG